MTWFEKVLEQYTDAKIEDLHTALPCRIESIDENNGTANVQPLASGYPLLIDVPMLYQPYEVDVSFDIVGGGSYSGETVSGTFTCLGPIYQVGDRVLVVFSERPTDSRYTRKHALEDGYIVGGIPIANA